VIKINLPPLRDRKEDILLLTSYFLKKFSEEAKIKVKVISKEVEELVRKFNMAWKCFAVTKCLSVFNFIILRPRDFYK
jgi:transcriptional regulator with GAF, ATPase, and Fis domain